MSKKITNSEFLEKLKQSKNKYIEVLDEYKGSDIRLKCRCVICKNEYFTYPSVILKGCGCRKCVSKQLGKLKRMTHEEFIKKLETINKDLIIIGTYIKSNINIEYKCKKCGLINSATPNNLLSGNSCIKCCGTALKTHEEFIDDFLKLPKQKDKIDIIGKYNGANKKIECACKKCKTKFFITPSKLLQGQGCAVCSGTFKKTHEEFVIEVKKIHNDIEVISKYEADHKKVECKCLICGKQWSVKATNIINGTGCPNCRISKLEKRTARILDDNFIVYEQQKRFKNCKYIRPLPFDFYIKSQSIAIECDGAQHYKPVKFGSISEEEAIKNFNENKIRDKIKEEYCKNNNIKLIRIPYWRIKTIDKLLLKEGIISGN